MAVSPNQLLNIKAPDVRPTASAAKAGQPAQDQGASFAEVYARERQAKPAESSEATARPAARDQAEPEQPAADAPAEEQTLAAAGNPLPAGDQTVPEMEVSELDPSLLLGLPTQAPLEASAERQLPGVAFAPLPGLVSPSASPDVAQGEPTAGEEMLLANLAAGPDKKTSPQSAASPQALGLSAERAAQVLQAGGETPDESLESDSELSFGDLLETPEAAGGNRTFADPSLNRLHPLAQAVTTQGLQAQQAQQPTQVPGQPVQLQQGGWSEAVVDRVMWMSSQNLKSAEIQLDPAELGRMEVRIEMTKDQAQVTFLSAHAGVRDQLEGQMQRLRDMFAQQGMSMDVNVSDQSQTRGWQGQGQDGDGPRGREVSSAGEEEVAGVMEIGSDRSSGNRGLVDYYA